MSTSNTKPRVALLIDTFGWAFHTIANAIAFYLGDQYDCTILAADETPQIDADAYDILHVFGGDQTYHHLFPRGKAKILKSMYCHLWQKHNFPKEELFDMHLHDADAVSVPSLLLLEELQHLPVPLYLFPEGVDTGTFVPGNRNSGPLIAGWAGNAADPLKNTHLLRQACDNICELKMATGDLRLHEMVNFYQSIDVILCTSEAEGCPRPVLEALSCGKFVVSFPVGIVPEVVAEPLNGIIVRDKHIDSMKTALQWCAQEVDYIRDNTGSIAEHMRAHRQWRSATLHVADAYEDLLRR